MISMEAAEGIIRNIAKRQAFQIDNTKFKPEEVKGQKGWWTIYIDLGAACYSSAFNVILAEMDPDEIRLVMKKGDIRIGTYSMSISKP